VANGLEAIQALRRQPYDVVLMDVQMPELNGLEATERIRKEFALERQPYIIAITASATVQDKDACLHAGMNDYLPKPFRVEELVAALRRSGEEPSPKSGVSKHMSVLGEESSYIDEEALAELRALTCDEEPSAFAELLREFLESTEKLLGDADRALGEGKPEQAAKSAHQIISTAKSFGANTLSDLARCLEEQAKALRIDEARVALDEMRVEYSGVQKHLAKHQAA